MKLVCLKFIVNAIMITIDELHSSIKKDRIKELMKYAEQYDMQNNEEVLEGIVCLNRLHDYYEYEVLEYGQFSQIQKN